MWVFLRDLYGGIAVFDTHSLVLNMILLWFTQRFSETDGDKFVIWKWWILSLFISACPSIWSVSPASEPDRIFYSKLNIIFILFYIIILLLLFLVNLRCLTLLHFLRIIKIILLPNHIDVIFKTLMSHYFNKKKYNKI